MSADSTDDEMHLTPDGWVNGTHFFYSEPEKIIPRPANAVETWNRQMRQSSSFSKEHVEWNCVWISPDYSKTERLAIKKKYPLNKW